MKVIFAAILTIILGIAIFIGLGSLIWFYTDIMFYILIGLAVINVIIFGLEPSIKKILNKRKK